MVFCSGKFVRWQPSILFVYSIQSEGLGWSALVNLVITQWVSVDRYSQGSSKGFLCLFSLYFLIHCLRVGWGTSHVILSSCEGLVTHLIRYLYVPFLSHEWLELFITQLNLNNKATKNLATEYKYCFNPTSSLITSTLTMTKYLRTKNIGKL